MHLAEAYCSFSYRPFAPPPPPPPFLGTAERTPGTCGGDLQRLARVSTTRRNTAQPRDRSDRLGAKSSSQRPSSSPTSSRPRQRDRAAVAKPGLAVWDHRGHHPVLRARSDRMRPGRTVLAVLMGGEGKCVEMGAGDGRDMVEQRGRRGGGGRMG